jgi:hypothetical protein
VTFSTSIALLDDVPRESKLRGLSFFTIGPPKSETGDEERELEGELESEVPLNRKDALEGYRRRRKSGRGDEGSSEGDALRFKFVGRVVVLSSPSLSVSESTELLRFG